MQDQTPKRKVQIDAGIFRRIQQGEQEAFRELYDVTHKLLYAFLLSYTLNREDAQDLLQDTYIQIYKNCHQYRDQGNPMAWMMKIAKNLFLMKCRRNKGTEDNFEILENDIGFEDMTHIENRIVLEKMFEQLSVEDRNMIIMHDIGGLKHREIAKLLDMPLGTVMARYHRGIRKLQKEFGESI